MIIIDTLYELRDRVFYKNALKEIGNKYNKFTLLSINDEETYNRYEKTGYRKAYMNCKCECGVIKICELGNLRNGNIKSCGCSKFNNPKILHDLVGKRFGRLVVLERDMEKAKNNKWKVHWICQCDCGKIKTVSASRLLAKKNGTKSCGCLARDVLIERNKNWTDHKPRGAYKKNDIKTKTSEYVEFFDECHDNTFIVDSKDANFITKWFWRQDKKGYWITNAQKNDVKNGRPKSLKLHQLIAERKYGGYDKNKYIPDHLSRDKNDNTRKNIKLKTIMENAHNRSLSRKNKTGKTGVYKQRGKWVATIMINYKSIKLGTFNNYEEAVKKRKEAEKKYGFTCDDVKPAYDL